MADSGQRTEEPTQRRLEKARKEGNFPASKELISAVHFLGVVTLTGSFGSWFLLQLAFLTKRLLASAFQSGHLTGVGLTAVTRNLIAPLFVPLVLGGIALMLLVVGVQLATTRMGIAGDKLKPDLKRLNPWKKLQGIPGQNLPVFLQSLVLLPLVGAAVYFEVFENWNNLLEMAWMPPIAAVARVGDTVETLLWRAAGLFLVVGLVDLTWQKRRYRKQLRMTKQEVRDEHKEQEGDPQIKSRVRRLQRDMARRQMLKDVPDATAVIVNPTHYAVAIRYVIPDDPNIVPAAPKVIAKGRNFLAARIKQKALEHDIPIVENPPLARALYSSVEVGQEIPAHLYRAVAEILAYIYRILGRLPG